jgi:hypothetical protein
MTEEQKTLLAERYPYLIEAIEAADCGLRAVLEIQITPESLGKIARAWEIDTKLNDTETHDTYNLRFTYETVDVCLYSMIPKQ